MEKQKDILGCIPEIGDIIVFNPPHYKGLVHGYCIGFSSSGLPQVDIYINPSPNNFYTPKTGFVTIKKLN